MRMILIKLYVFERINCRQRKKKTKLLILLDMLIHFIAFCPMVPPILFMHFIQIKKNNKKIAMNFEML